VTATSTGRQIQVIVRDVRLIHCAVDVYMKLQKLQIMLPLHTIILASLLTTSVLRATCFGLSGLSSGYDLQAECYTTYIGIENITVFV
jgi:hypothetical protein